MVVPSGQLSMVELVQMKCGFHRDYFNSCSCSSSFVPDVFLPLLIIGFDSPAHSAMAQ